MSQTMHIDDLDRMISEAIRPSANGYRIMKRRWGVKHGLPADVASIVLGNPKKGVHWNVASPEIPEHTKRGKNGRITTWGWRTTLKWLRKRPEIGESPEMDRWLAK